MCDRCKPAFNFALNANRFALPVDGSCTTKERDMKRLIACVIGVALLAGSVGLMIANAEHDGIQPGDAKELLDEPVHARDVGPQFLELAVSIHRLESRGNDRERRAKLMGGIDSYL